MLEKLKNWNFETCDDGAIIVRESDGNGVFNGVVVRDSENSTIAERILHRLATEISAKT